MKCSSTRGQLEGQLSALFQKFSPAETIKDPWQLGNSLGLERSTVYTFRSGTHLPAAGTKRRSLPNKDALMLASAHGWLAPALPAAAATALRLAAPALLRHLGARPHAHAHHPIPNPHIHPQSEEPQPHDHVPHQLSCIVPEQPSQPPLPCLGLKYAPRVWGQVAELFPDRHASPPICIAITPDLSESTSLCPATATPGHELQAAGFQVTSLLLHRPTTAAHGQQCGGVPEKRQCCLQVAAEQATAAAAGQGQAPSGQGQAARAKLPGADLFCFADTMHMVDVRRALQAAHRHLRPLGLLLVLWTDLDLSDGFVLGLEEALEAAMPGYCRYDCQRDPAIWVPRLQLGGLFRLIDYSALPHSLSLPASAFLDSLDSRAALRSALGTAGRRGFHARMQRLVGAHFRTGAAHSPAAEAAAVEAGTTARIPSQQQMVHLSLHTKAYLLARAAAVVPPVLGGSQAPRGQLEPERVCLFCGSPVALD